jgi:hypothetical protein
MGTAVPPHAVLFSTLQKKKDDGNSCATSCAHLMDMVGITRLDDTGR